MKHRQAWALGLLALVNGGNARADETIPTVRLNNLLGPSLAVTRVEDKPCSEWCFVNLTPGVLVDAEVGLAGLKGSLGMGLGSHEKGDVGVVSLKATAVHTWAQPLLHAHEATYVGTEADLVFTYGVSLGALKRVDGPGWRFSAALVRAL